MKIYNTVLKLASRENLGTRSLARFIHIMLRENVLNSRPKREYFRIFGGGLKLQGITKKKFHLYIPGKLLVTAENLKVNEQSKHKSVPIFLFIAIKRKPEICNS